MRKRYYKITDKGRKIVEVLGDAKQYCENLRSSPQEASEGERENSLPERQEPSQGR